MNTYPSPTHQPYVICFVGNFGRLRAVNADPANPGIDEDFAIYATRYEANTAIAAGLANDRLDVSDGTVYFSVPATALFDHKTVTKEVFTFKR